VTGRRDVPYRDGRESGARNYFATAIDRRRFFSRRDQANRDCAPDAEFDGADRRSRALGDV